MLYLNPPALVLDPLNVCVYPDHENAQTWYYLPMYPRVSRSSSGKPLLALTKYTSNTDNFALLNFDVNLGLSKEELKACRKRLKERLEEMGRSLKGEPELLPMAAKRGSVELTLLGRKSAGDKLVRGISQAASPALYNDNRAVFSVLLDPAGSEIVEATLTKPGALSAVAVMYALEIDALRPAYKVSARASWNTVHTYLKEAFKHDGFFSGADISKVVDRMKDEKVIAIQVDNMLSDEEQGTAIQAMMGQLRAMVFEQFFKPAPVPEPSGPPSFLSELGQLATKQMAFAATGGLSLLGKFSWTREDRTELLNRSLEIDLSERAVVPMKLYPQAFLADLSQPGQDLVQEIDGGQSDFFTRRQLTVDVNQLFGDDIASVVVDLDYGGKKQSRIFRKGTEQTPQPVSWTSVRGRDGKLQRDVRVSYTVNFAPRKNGTVPAALQAPARIEQGDFCTISPASLYSVNRVMFFSAPDFNWAQYPLITLTCRYEDAAHGVALEWKTALSNKDKEDSVSASWSYLSVDPQRKQYRYRIGYQQVGGKVVELDWMQSELPSVVLSPSRIDLLVYPPKTAYWPSGVDCIQLDLAYDDPANQIALRVPVRFEPGQNAMRKVQLLVADPRQRTVNYKVSCIGERSFSGPPSRTRQASIALAAPRTGRTFAVLQPAPGLFANGKISKVVAKLRHVEDGQELAKTEKVFRASDTDPFVFEYDYLSDPAYLCKLVYSFADAPPLTTAETEISSLDQYLIQPPKA